MISRNSSLNEIKDLVKRCLDKVYLEEGRIFEKNNGRGVCERMIVFRFAYYLQSEFLDPQSKLQNWFVDCDYNSSFENGQERSGKQVVGPHESPKNSFPDVIVHKRMNDGSDLICFEIKKWNNYDKEGIKKDENNLAYMTSDSGYNYVYGFYIKIHKQREKTKMTIFESGTPINGEKDKLIF